jgi:diguanylate cyclase (GGDEF)-like protein
MLSDLGSYLQACGTKEEAYSVVQAHLCALFPDRSGALYELGKEASADCVMSWGCESAILSHPLQTGDCWALRRGVVHDTSDDRATLHCKHYNGIGEGNQYCIPVMTQNGPIGLLTLHTPVTEGTGKNSHSACGNLPLMTRIADRLGPTLLGIELRNRLHEDSIRDPLTKLYNRRFLDESLHRELLRGARSNTPVSVIVLDLDNFKMINDEYGHDVGDQVLVTLAFQLNKAVREEDLVYRFGGEEFVVVMPAADQRVAEARAEQLCDAIRSARFETSKGALHVTVSAGVATSPEHGTEPEELVSQADAALYQAKEAGRDRFVLAAAIGG